MGDTGERYAALHNECHTCGRKWTSATRPANAERSAMTHSPCMGGVEWDGLRTDISTACGSVNITTVVGDTFSTLEEAFASGEQ